MSIDAVREFFMWCTIINGSLLILSFLITAYAGDWVYRMNSLWYLIPRDTFNVVIYCFIGLFKIFVLYSMSFPTSCCSSSNKTDRVAAS
jgi:hypothetical protein